MDQQERVERAADLAMRRNRQRTSVQRRGMVAIDISKAAEEYGVDAGDVARELSKRRSYRKQIEQPPARRRAVDKSAKEKCRECGQDLERGENRCPLCGTDTAFIWGGLSIENIIVNLKKLCEDGLRVSDRLKLRKALKDLSKDMVINSSKYSKAINKRLIIEVKRK